jgi:hypothetical protein
MCTFLWLPAQVRARNSLLAIINTFQKRICKKSLKVYFFRMKRRSRLPFAPFIRLPIRKCKRSWNYHNNGKIKKFLTVEYERNKMCALDGGRILVTVKARSAKNRTVHLAICTPTKKIFMLARLGGGD